MLSRHGRAHPRPREDHLYVENIAVDPSAQGRGLGRAGSRPPRAHPHGLVTYEAITETQAICARLGYVEIERRTEDGYRRIYMKKPLAG